MRHGAVGGIRFNINKNGVRIDVTELNKQYQTRSGVAMNGKSFDSPLKFSSFLLSRVHIQPQVNVSRQTLVDQVNEQRNPVSPLIIQGDFSRATLELHEYKHHIDCSTMEGNILGHYFAVPHWKIHIAMLPSQLWVCLTIVQSTPFQHRGTDLQSTCETCGESSEEAQNCLDLRD